MNIVGLFVYSYTRKAHYTGALILMGDLQLCKKSCRNRAWLGVNRCVFVAGKRRTTISVQVKSTGSSPILQTRYVTPSASTQYINPQTGYDGLKQCVVYGDSNLVSSNIKSRVSIFGVSGSLIKNEIAFITGNNFVHYSSGSLSRWEWTINFSWEKILFCVFYLEAASREWITEIHVTPIVKNSSFKEAFDDCKGIQAGKDTLAYNSLGLNEEKTKIKLESDITTDQVMLDRSFLIVGYY